MGKDQAARYGRATAKPDGNPALAPLGERAAHSAG